MKRLGLGLCVLLLGCGDDGGAATPSDETGGTTTADMGSSTTSGSSGGGADDTSTGSGSDTGDDPPGFGGGARYCEILLAFPADEGLDVQVWGTHGLNECPAESWDALDPAVIQADTGAAAVIMNGPRYWLPFTTGTLPPPELMMFGDIQMRHLADVLVDPAMGMMMQYVEITVLRETSYLFEAGTEIYELTSPEGVVYVMQSMSQIVDPDLMLEDLPTLGDRLMLPTDWSYAARTLDEDLVLETESEATVVQDDLTNTYQRATP